VGPYLGEHLGLTPIFDTVSDLGIRPTAYLFGSFGGAGAVASIVKRFDEIASRHDSPWLSFAQGLFNLIVGSLVAVVACRFVSSNSSVDKRLG